MSTQGVPFRLTPLQWLPADQVMLQQASKPFASRLTTCKVVSHIAIHCFGSAPKQLTHNAIKRRYQTYFLGPLASVGPHPSLVEQADTMMESEALKPRSRTPSQLAEEIKKSYFKKSKSELLTLEAIEKRYRTVFLKWADADGYMQWVAKASCNKNENVPFTIGLVVDYVKQKCFPDDEFTPRDDVEQRYCERWLGIPSSAATVRNYDSQLVAKAWSGIQSDLANDVASRGPETDTSMGKQFGYTAWPSMHQQQTVVGDASQGSQRMVYPPSPAFTAFSPETGPARHNHKRARPNSTNSECVTIQDGTTFNFPKPPSSVKSQKPRRDSGFFSAISTKDSSSLLASMSRLSIRYELCPEDHTFTHSESPCRLCHFPEPHPKPRVYLAPEYHPPQPQRAEDIDADDMDNGIMMTNANARRM